MKYNKEKIESCFDYIISEMESGSSLRSALKTNGMPSSATFYNWLDESEERLKRYARACEDRELLLLDEILIIADKQEADVIATDSGNIVNHNVIQRCKLQIEARQWVLGKLNAPKYGNKVHQELSGQITTNIINLGDGIDPNEATN
jgi:hypothetical protein